MTQEIMQRVFNRKKYTCWEEFYSDDSLELLKHYISVKKHNPEDLVLMFNEQIEKISKILSAHFNNYLNPDATKELKRMISNDSKHLIKQRKVYREMVTYLEEKVIPQVKKSLVLESMSA